MIDSNETRCNSEFSVSLSDAFSGSRLIKNHERFASGYVRAADGSTIWLRGVRRREHPLDNLAPWQHISMGEVSKRCIDRRA